MMVTRIKRGVYGGVAGGVVFGGMMGMMGMLTMIGSMVGSSSAWVGFVVHMMISGAIGGTFGAVVDLSGLRANVGAGLAYGVMWWVLGPLTLMPAFMGMGFGVNWNVAAMSEAMPSLVGHLVFGAILGVTVRWLDGLTHGSGAYRTYARAS